MRWVFHIGFPKTATTSIQAVLPKLSGVFFAGKEQGFVHGKQGELILRRWLPNLTRWNTPVHLIAEWRREIEDMAAVAGAATVAVSEEDLTNFPAAMPPLEICHNIANLFGPNVSFVFVVRNHWDLLRSTYKERVKNGMPYDFRHFCVDLISTRHYGLLHKWNYANLFSTLAGSGVDMNVFLFERFISERSYQDQFFSLMGAHAPPQAIPHENPTPDDQELEWLRTQNLAMFGGTFALAPVPSEFLKTHERDRRQLEWLASYLGVSDGTFPAWSVEMHEKIKLHWVLNQHPESAATGIDWSLPQKLAEELTQIFAAACFGLDAFVGEPSAPYGYAEPHA
ncbi:hypothetical protein X727_14020 [Mesorhizobium sp. L103C119B0]|uniref:hypothetical protein n=1 Tax=Mesorhizobium sp. L103C119B0 TaxID=1287085 RepID=UPI0003D05F2D|nr:hypothetical protein [Mesorhizobium sp. L103C119B0]ESZ70708.1 hypothetical protein X727_14020 [Mesorhizobium sp. L103C119B0]